MGDYGLFAQILALKLSRDLPLAHDQHAICEPEDLRQFGGDDDRRTCPRRRGARSEL